jgi:murein L,D-transpeptidase YcbB/YkuD
MERLRWLNNTFPEEFILVSIASYNLYLYKNNEVDYQCRVVVGKEHTKTPVFTSKIKYVVLNPTWTVPYSIASKEILPKLKKDNHYLQNRNMTLLKGGKAIDPLNVDFSRLSSGNFPYTIRQEPGPNNALGLVKFIFPNKFSVYLHDTPSKSYFNRADRAFSHGCIRVQNPLILTELLLADKGYDMAKINEVLKKKETKTVHLSKEMPVMLMYMTCYENMENDKIYFYQDIYGRDKRILNELKKKM